MAAAAPVVKLLNYILYQAIRDKASDIHLEPFEGDFKIRYRVDGSLFELEAPPPHLAEALIGKWTTRKDDDGNKVRGVFKPSKHEQEDWDRFDDIVRELKAARIEGAKAAADAEDDEAQKNALAAAVFAQM